MSKLIAPNICDSNKDTDLFDHYDSLPAHVRKVVDRYCNGDNSYELCKKLITALNKIGYTCDYGLDGQPYNLKKLPNTGLKSIGAI